MSNHVLFFVGALLAIPCLASNGNMAGSGTAEDPWQVADYEDLKAVGVGDYSMNGHYVLVADINATDSWNEKNESDSTEGFQPIGVAYYGTLQSAFGGVFDGADHTISNLYSMSKGTRSTALFMGIDSNGVVKNLKMTNCVFTVRLVWAAATVAVMNSGLIENIKLERDTVFAPGNTGGVVGINENGTVQNIEFNGAVFGINERLVVGGVVGHNAGEKSVIRNVKINADMSSSYYGEYLGLVAGKNEGKIVSAEVEGILDHGNRFLGGVAGSNSGSIDSCISRASIFSMNENTGGLVGYNSGTINNSSVEADSVFGEFRGAAGFVGTNDTTGIIENGFAKTNVHSDSSGGFAVYNAGIIKNSRMEGTVTADSFPGRLVSGFVLNNSGTILNSHSTANVDAFNNLSGFVFRNSGKIDSCYATGHVNNGNLASGDTYGGFVAQNDSTGVITNSYASGNVVGGMKAGGFVGINKGKIRNCYATGDVRSYSVFGGFAGANYGEILYSYATGTLDRLPDYNDSYTAGGFVGANEGLINNAYATGNVVSGYTPGGFVSSNAGTIKNAFAAGTISGSVEPGGFVYSNDHEIENAFFVGKLVALDGSVEGAGCYAVDNSGSIKNAFYNKDDCDVGDDSTVEGVAYADMKKLTLYKDWTDFDKYWVLNDSMPYPQLAFTAGVIPDEEPPQKNVKPNSVALKSVNNLMLYGSLRNMSAKLTLSRSGLTLIKVYNMNGRVQKAIPLGMMGEGVHHVNLNGAVEARGMAVFVLEQDGRVLSKTLFR